MSGPLIALAAAGTYFSIRSQRKQAKAQAAAALADAQAKRKQAFELLDRVEFNIGELKKEGAKLGSSQQAAFIKGGVDISSGTPLDVLSETFAAIEQEEMIQRKEAEFKADQLFAGADIETRLSGDIASASKTQQYATLLGGAGDVIKASQK